MSPTPISTLTPPPDLSSVAARLKGVTGFVSILTQPGDERTRVFARYYHVRRVAWVARYLASTKPGNPRTNEDLDWYAWAHDLNRWPFAHNSERGVFEQAKDLPRYVEDEGLVASTERIQQLQAIIDKQPERLDSDASIVLLADIVTGFIEDPLWLLATLNVTPKVIPPSVAEYLCVPLEDRGFLESMLDLLQTFSPGVELIAFIDRFDAFFIEIAQTFISSRIIAPPMLNAASVLLSEDFTYKRSWIKEDFMRRVIFPYNNEKISRGSKIRSMLFDPLLPLLEVPLAQHLTRATDESLLSEAIERSVLAEKDRPSILPDLDYMEREELDASFKFFMGI